MVSDELFFIIFCIENYKVHRSITGKQTVRLFQKYGVFDYLKEFYDVLHTTGYQYINNDIDKTLFFRRKNTKPAVLSAGFSYPCLSLCARLNHFVK